jgi:hypothetical protein
MNWGLDVKFCGVTGREEAVPIASWGVGGFVGRSERSDFVGSKGSLCTNCVCCQYEYKAWRYSVAEVAYDLRVFW